MLAYLPSACSLVASTPGSLEAVSTTAPAPSPNSTQVVRSSKLRMRENTSAPITSTFLCAPDLMKLSATDTAYTKPLHTACTSTAAHSLVMPSLFCTTHAVLGKPPKKSGVDVATIIRSTSLGMRPAACNACLDASTPMSLDCMSASA